MNIEEQKYLLFFLINMQVRQDQPTKKLLCSTWYELRLFNKAAKKPLQSIPILMIGRLESIDNLIEVVFCSYAPLGCFPHDIFLYHVVKNENPKRSW